MHLNNLNAPVLNVLTCSLHTRNAWEKMLPVRNFHYKNHRTDVDEIWMGLNNEMFGRISVLCNRARFGSWALLLQLILDYIHIFEVVSLQVIMRPTDLTLEMGKLLAATGHHNLKFDAVWDQGKIGLRTVVVPQYVIRFSCVTAILGIRLNGTFPRREAS